MKSHLYRITFVVAAALLFSLIVATLPAPAQEPELLNSELTVVRFGPVDSAELSDLVNQIDVWHYDRVGNMAVAAVTDAQRAELEAGGYIVTVDLFATVTLHRLPNDHLPEQQDGIPGYPCYRTVEETFATAEQIVADYPHLAQWIDAGDSWEKTQDPSAGYDMMVLRLTNLEIDPTDKPKLFVTTSIHAREYTPAELATRFAEYLVTNYGVDADVTWILDHHDIHLMLQANPDGRKFAEIGYSWRKNTNENYCSPTSFSRGADLNRNFPFEWGQHNGSSGNQCSLTYRGPSPASEPETQAVTSYMQSIFPDQRGPALTDAAPDDAMGVYFDIHSYGELVLWPWGFFNTVAPNGTQFQTFGRKLAYFNDYYPEQAIGLYPTDGTTDDFGYGELGVASLAFEVGTSFFQSCYVFENEVLPDNLPALLYAAKVARTPYMTPAGPDALDVAVSAAEVTAGETISLTATIDDTRFNNQNGTEPTQRIHSAEYYIDVPPWDPSAPTGTPMLPTAGPFGAPVEDVIAEIDTSGLSDGRHTIYVRGRDTDGNWGPVSAVFLDVNVALPPDGSGDVSCDASTNVVDALFVLQYDVALRDASSTCPLDPDTLYMPACDVDGNTTCDVVDALFILQCDVGLSNVLCPATARQTQIPLVTR